jgi:hypothetical protein
MSKVMKISAEQMFINKLSVVSTADGKGVAIQPLNREMSRYEVCVAVRDGVLSIAVYMDGVEKQTSSFGHKVVINPVYEN